MTTPDDQIAEDPADNILPEEDLVAQDQNDEAETDQEDDDAEGEEGEGGGGKKSGGGGKKPGVDVKLEDQFFDYEDLSEYDSETLIEKLKLLAWAPFSMMVPGASAFESESELKRKLFLGEIGLKLNEIEPHDIADPDLIAKLERRLQQRQEMQAQAQAQMVAAAAGVAVAAGGLAAMPELPDPVPVAQPPQPKEPSLDIQKETATLKATNEQAAKAAEQKKAEEIYRPEKPEQDYYADRKPEEQKNDIAAAAMLLMPEPSFAENMETPRVNEGQAPQLDAVSPSAISNLFMAVASVTEYTAPQQKTDFRLPDPAPKLDTGGAGPMG